MNMNGCLNILWHFPFFGFLFAFFYALFGAILCCTVILYPVGLGFFQIARFLLTPFSSALVTRRELNLVRPEERSTAAAAYSTVITILYFPFGLIAAAGALFAMIGEFLSIIGIPCGIVWFKALPAIFMPVDKVCVPKAVADEIARIKAGDTVRRYKDETEEPETHSAERHSTDNFSEPLPAVPQVRQYDDDKLHGIIANPEMYKASLVDDCRRELEIRSKGAALMPKIEAYDDAGLREVLANPQMYSDEVLYCCQKVDAERRRIVRERQEREAELARLRREQEEKAAAERRAKKIAEVRIKLAAAWKKWRYPIYAVVIVAVCIALAAYLSSNTHRYNRGVKFAEAGLAEKAIGCLSLISDSKFEHYSAAKYLLYKQYLQQQDSAAAAEALIASIAAEDWETPNACIEYAHYCLNGKFTPYIPCDPLRAASVYRNAPDEDYRLCAGHIYFDQSEYSEAYEIFDKLSHIAKARGYLGIMHFYGLGALHNNAQLAWDYLKDAPDAPPFVVLKGDLSLFARNKDKDRNNRFEAIRQADQYYQLAKQEYPANRAVELRAEATRQMLAAYDRHEKRQRENWSDSKWNFYTFDSGSYEGEYGCWGNECGAQGWGCFTWNNDRGMWFGRYVNCKMNGLGIQISDYVQDDNGGLGTYMRISVGYWRNGNLDGEGYFTEYDGTTKSGTWKDYELVKGTKCDLHGQVTETIK